MENGWEELRCKIKFLDENIERYKRKRITKKKEGTKEKNYKNEFHENVPKIYEEKRLPKKRISIEMIQNNHLEKDHKNRIELSSFIKPSGCMI